MPHENIEIVTAAVVRALTGLCSVNIRRESTLQ
jgi:hypothetical protein